MAGQPLTPLRVAACALRDALSSRPLRRLQLAWAATSVGGWTFFVALAVYAYDVGGAPAVGLAAVVRMAPAALAAPAMSLLGDRYSRRNVLLALALIRAGVLAAAAVLVWADGPAALVFGVVEGTYWLTTGIGSLLAPVLVAALGLRGALLAVGAALPALVLARWRALARLEASTPVPEREYRLLRGVAMLAPLPIARLEELARRVTHVRYGAGEPIIREGEPGDRFYVIADGEVNVTERGAFRRTEPAGDCFGEIALLRSVPRTATVVARTEVELLALEREEFLAAITGDRRALAAGHELIESRLAPV